MKRLSPSSSQSEIIRAILDLSRDIDRIQASNPRIRGDLDMAGYRITNHGVPQENNDVAIKGTIAPSALATRTTTLSGGSGGGGGGTGTVVGPSLSTDNAVARWDGTSGDTLQNSDVIIDDDDNVAIPGTLNVTADGTPIPITAAGTAALFSRDIGAGSQGRIAIAGGQYAVIDFIGDGIIGPQIWGSESPRELVLYTGLEDSSSGLQLSLTQATNSLQVIEDSGYFVLRADGNNLAVYPDQAAGIVLGTFNNPWSSLYIGNNTFTGHAQFTPPLNTLSNSILQAPEISGTLALSTESLAQFAATSSAALRGVISDETGTNLLVFNETPTLDRPNIAIIANLTTNGFVKTIGGNGTLDIDTNTYLTTSGAAAAYQPLDADLTSWAAITRGTGFDTAAAINVGSAGAFVTFNGALGTPSSGVATNLTGTASGLTAGTVTTNANLTGPITSVGNATSIASQTGTGTKFVVDTSPTLVTPVIGVATGTSLALAGTASPLTAARDQNSAVAAVGVFRNDDTSSATPLGSLNYFQFKDTVGTNRNAAYSGGILTARASGTVTGEWVVGLNNATASTVTERFRVTSSGITLPASSTLTAGSVVMTPPAATGTLATLAGSEALSNKTYAGSTATLTGLVKASSLNATLSGTELSLGTGEVAMFSNRANTSDDAIVAINSGSGAGQPRLRGYKNGVGSAWLYFFGTGTGGGFQVDTNPGGSGMSMVLSQGSDIFSVYDSAGNQAFQVQGTAGTPSVAQYGKTTTYNNIATAGIGVVPVWGEGISATKTASFAAAATLTPPATAGRYRVGAVITTTSATNTGTLQVTVDYRDAEGNTQTDILPIYGTAGTAPGASITSAASKNFHTIPTEITINNAATAINVNVVVVSGTVSYKVAAYIEQLG